MDSVVTRVFTVDLARTSNVSLSDDDDDDDGHDTPFV
jgi:hypothetical protein